MAPDHATVARRIASTAVLPDELQVDARQLFCGRHQELEDADEVIDTTARRRTVRLDLDPRRTGNRKDPPRR